jgi:hypothetical protein
MFLGNGPAFELFGPAALVEAVLLHGLIEQLVELPLFLLAGVGQALSHGVLLLWDQASQGT